jgi:hypothetical protein
MQLALSWQRADAALAAARLAVVLTIDPASELAAQWAPMPARASHPVSDRHRMPHPAGARDQLFLNRYVVP